MNNYLLNGVNLGISQANFTKFHGTSIFTTLKSREGHPLLWNRHWRRLSEQAEYFNFVLPDENHIVDLIQENAKNRATQKIRILISGQDWALSFEDCENPPSHIYEGVAVCFSRWQVHPQLAGFKTGNSLPYVLAAQDAHKEKVFEALLFDQAGHVVDGSRTSIMHYDGEKLCALLGGLQGCMREEALAYASAQGVGIDRRYFKPEDISGQLMVANSLIGVVPVGPPRYPLVHELVNHFRMDF